MKRKLFMLALIAMLALSMVACNRGRNRYGDKISESEWPTTDIARQIDYPLFGTTYLETNRESNLTVKVYGCKQNDYKEYVEACKAKGFTIDVESDEDNFEAFNTDGYKLSVDYYDYRNDNDDNIRIDVDAPQELESITWPTMGCGALLPVPPNLVGEIHTDKSDRFSVSLKMSKEEMAEYVDACIQNGFDIDYSKDSDYYSAQNRDGYEISIRYMGNAVTEIYVSKEEPETETSEKEQTNAPTTIETEPSTAAPIAAPTEAPTEAPADLSDGSGINPELKAFLDDYEAWVDSYCEFMRKYAQADVMEQLNMTQDYVNMTKQLTELSQELDDWDASTTTLEDSEYYLEVYTRCMEKIANI